MDESKPVYEFGDCFRLSAEAVLHGAAEELALALHLRSDEVKLVHGMATIKDGPLQGVRFVHAWVEFMSGALVMDVASGKPVIMSGYNYRYMGTIKQEEVQYYSREEVVGNLLASGHYGPWYEPFVAHGREEKQKIVEAGFALPDDEPAESEDEEGGL